jgi:hypothetical protein
MWSRLRNKCKSLIDRVIAFLEDMDPDVIAIVGILLGLLAFKFGYAMGRTFPELREAIKSYISLLFNFSLEQLGWIPAYAALWFYAGLTTFSFIFNLGSDVPLVLTIARKVAALWSGK